MIAEVNISEESVAAEVQAVCREAYTLEAERIGFLDLPPLIETAEDLQRSTDRFLVFRHEEAIVGALSFHAIPETLVISRLVVKPAYLRRGIGTALLRAMECTTSAGGRIKVTTAQANTPAVRFYERNGFVPGEVTIVSQGLVLVHLTKELQSC
jgi:GNAT superfamily N-acetyltransferase